ncbi:MAG: YdeI/OmpD-associated family protein, partial [Bacteroidales bacterium]|nr:YdeI/OmpD-associated family protein [Bacteroidales bacterium]
MFLFNNLAPFHKRNFVLWITQAKREDTSRKRL